MPMLCLGIPFALLLFACDLEAMIRKTAAVELARAVYPDVIGGLCDPDEFADDEAVA